MNNNDWRNASITPRQKEAIDFIKSYACEIFNGKTRGEVSVFIGKYLEQAKKICKKEQEAMAEDANMWAITHGYM